jgi:hypothetical protein
MAASHQTIVTFVYVKIMIRCYNFESIRTGPGDHSFIPGTVTRVRGDICTLKVGTHVC